MVGCLVLGDHKIYISNTLANDSLSYCNYGSFRVVQRMGILLPNDLN